MHVSLIGMSNIGKSYWSRRMATEAGYEVIRCDDLIEKKLASELIKLGYHGIHDVGQWMGQPYDTQYPSTSQKYLACEREALMQAIVQLRAKPANKPLVIDTTGSVIYLDNEITAELKSLTRIIHFEASLAHKTKLFERYMAHPKPVIWGDCYQPHANETRIDTLKRCYPDLLAYRAERYAALAHDSVPYEQHHVRDRTWMQMMGTAS